MLICVRMAYLTTASRILFAGKTLKLYTEVAVNLQRDPYLPDNQSAVQESPARSSSQLAVRSPTMMKPLKNTRTGECPQQTDEENGSLGLFVPLG